MSVSNTYPPRNDAPHKSLHLDFETRSRIDLPKVGAHRYAQDESTEALCAAFAVNDEPVQLWLPGEPVPAEFIEAEREDDWIVAAHNATFERAIMRHVLMPRHAWPEIPLERWRCSMAQAYACALPGKLEKIAEALELPHQKDAEGARLMRRLSKPRADGSWGDDPELLRRLYEYCRQDVEVERDLHRALPELLPDEQLLWQLDQVINDRGFYTDTELLEAAHRVVEEGEDRLLAEFRQLTELDSPAQVAKLIAWLTDHGCEVTDLQKGTLSHALRRKGLSAEVRRAIELRQALAHTSAVKVEALRAWRMDDGRVRGALVYHGAATGRWVGRGPQPQNFKRDGDRITEKISAVLAGGDGLESPIEAVGDIARAMIIAAPGHRLMVADFSGIESRVLAWISGERSKLAMWSEFDRTQAERDDPYFIGGRKIGHPEATARAAGKIADLAFGYQGGIGAWKNFAPEDDDSDEPTIKRYRDAWRNAHSATVRFWYAVDIAALRAVRQPGIEHQVGRVKFCYDAPFLRATLPAGRSITYPFPRIELNRYGRFCVVFKDSAGGKWADCKFGAGAYGGLWTENIVSGIARDLLAAALIRLEEAGYRIVLHVHDEITVEVPDGFSSLEEFRSIVETPPAWAEGLPIRAKARESLRFSKEDAASGEDILPSELGDADTAVELILGADGYHDDGGGRDDPGLEAEDPEEDTSPRRPWSTPTIGEALPGSTEFEEILATLSPEDREIVQPLPPPRSNGGGAPRGNGQAREDHNRDGYPHGEYDDEAGGSGHQPTVYIYRDARGRPYLGVKRTPGKQFPQFHSDGARWLKGKPKGPKIPYRLPELLDAQLDAWVLICAGEKDADTAASLGFVATTNSEGESPGKWTPDLNAWFIGRKHVAVMEDNDATGRAHALEVAGAMRTAGVPDVRIVSFRELYEQQDLTDWVKQGHGKQDLQARIEVAKPYRFEPQPAPIRAWDGKPASELEYAVPERFPMEDVALFSGEGGQGKSTLLQQLCVAHALGNREWLGCIPRHGPAIYLECEDSLKALRWRLMPIADHYEVSLTNIADAGFQMFSLADEENSVLATAPDKSGIVRPTPLYDWLYEMAGDIKPVMIGIASSATVFAGNENVRTEVQQFIQLLRRITRVSGGGLLLISHPSLTGIGDGSASHAGLSGTTQWHNAVRSRATVRISKSEDGLDTGMREIKFHKNQYGSISASCYVRWQNGMFLPVEGMSMDAAERAAKADEVFIALLKKITAQGREVNHKAGSTYAPKVFAEQPDAQGITKKEFKAAMERLLDAKVIKVEDHGKASRPAYRLVLVGEG